MVTNDKCKMFRTEDKVVRMQLLGCSKEGTICYTSVLAYDATQMEKGFIYLSIYLSIYVSIYLLYILVYDARQMEDQRNNGPVNAHLTISKVSPQL